MNKDFESKMIIRNDEIDGVKDFYWLENDDGSWDGPRHDWLYSHNLMYFQHVKKYDTVVTAGGNQGLYTRLYSNMFKAVYSFEPDALNFHILCMNNQVHNVIKINACLGAEPGMTGLERISMTNTGMHRVSGEGIIPILTLDSFALPSLDLLQLDIEGYEINAIRGAEETIKKHRPVIALECGKTTQIEEFMRNLGYQHFADSVSDTVYIPSD